MRFKSAESYSDEIHSAHERAALVLVRAVWDRRHSRVLCVSGWRWNELVIGVQAKRSLPADVRAAIAAFLNQCQNEAKPFAGTEALGAIRTMFPELDISDADLEDAVFSEAANAGFDVGYEPRAGSEQGGERKLHARKSSG